MNLDWRFKHSWILEWRSVEDVDWSTLFSSVQLPATFSATEIIVTSIVSEANPSFDEGSYRKCMLANTHHCYMICLLLLYSQNWFKCQDITRLVPLLYLFIFSNRGFSIAVFGCIWCLEINVYRCSFLLWYHPNWKLIKGPAMQHEAPSHHSIRHGGVLGKCWTTCGHVHIRPLLLWFTSL